MIGRDIRHADPDAAQEAIAGYTIANDVSVRDFQRRTSQFMHGKTFDHTTPLGPVLVTPDEVVDGREIGFEPVLEIGTTIDDVQKQLSTTAYLLFGVLKIVSYVSQCMTFQPGDVILTGTPSGVGFGRSPQGFLRPGQVVETTIAGIGTLRNACIDEKERGE